ncbi:MAG: hypothetical protein DI529_09495 [Chryseobacterium sp.]|nr:MAG: hypothetical protein DI529_09495 [Chryseobacterium sp.]
MKLIYQIFLLAIFLISCKSEQQKQFEKNIIGEWNFAKDVELHIDKNQDYDEPPSPFLSNLGGFIFYKNATLIDKLGFFNWDEEKPREERRIVYKGDSTRYEIDDDSLKIFNPIRKSWNSYKIISITKDTLTIQKHKDYYLKYYNLKYKLNPSETFDKIIISSSGCYGTCPIMNIQFDKNGKVVYLGEQYNTTDGFFTSSMSIAEYKTIENSFKKANIRKLENSYSADISDQNRVTVTFVKNNKIIKTISDYASQAPSELIMAYRKAMFKYQQLKLSKFHKNENFPNSAWINFDENSKQIFLSQSEKFLLLNEILDAKKVQSNFKKKYKLIIYNDKDNDFVLESDGRFYKHQNDIYDLGYNFFDINNLENRTEHF